ncbi:PAS domain S-box protein [Spirulina sp. CS-785/01]|uniref:PAS domain S-box protein n=1 Tax=Spirulina sp. CS-785/01 TaxID=3021716 RepID=UPI0023300E03|nr:PAS domain S-box protein [Spirulina sp. CS-785/01]MDB9314534.1 PAS domain S-box protein [Spirulina sp. CS-785/01]
MIKPNSGENRDCRCSEQEQLFRLAFENAPIGMALVSLGEAQQGEVLRVNRALCQMLGYSETEFKQETVQNLIHPEDWQSDLEKVTQLMAGKNPSYELEKRIRHQQGHWVWIHLSVSLVRHEKESPLYCVCHIQDISHRKQTEQSQVTVQGQLQDLNQVLQTHLVEQTAQLRQNQERYQIATQAAKVGVWEWNIQTGEFYLDPNVKSFLGYSDEEIPNDLQVWETYVHPDDREWVMAEASAYLEGRSPEYRCEHRMIHKDGSIRWILVCGQLLRDEAGNTVRMIGSDTDITQRKLAELAIQASQVRFQRVASNAPGVIYQFLRWGNGEYQFIYISDRALELFEYSASEIQQNVNLMFDRFHPQDQASLYESIEESARTLKRWTWEGRFLAPSGRLKWIQGMSQPEQQADGSILWDGIVIDITSRKQAEQELKQQRYFIQRLAATVPSIIYLYDLQQQRYIYTNDAVHQLLGYTASVVHQPDFPWRIAYPEDVKRFQEHRQQLLQAQLGEVLELEYRLQHAEGHWMWLYSYDTVFKVSETGEVQQVLGIAHDISQRKQTEAALQESEAKFRQFATNIEDVFWLYSLDKTHCLYINPAFETVWGYSCTQLYENPNLWFEVIHPDDRAAVLAQLPRQRKGRCELEYRIIRPDGEIRWMRDRSFPVQNHQGEFYRIAGIAQDITQRKQAEAELRHHRDLREAIFNESTDALFLVDPDTLLILDCNRRAVELFAAQGKQSLIGTDGNMLQRQRFSRGEIQAICEQMKTQGFWSQEVEYITQTGTVFWGNLAAKPIQLANTTLNLVRVTDISDRKTVEAKLRKSESHLLAAQRIARLGSWEYNLLTGEIRWSQEVFRIFERTNPLPPTMETLMNYIHPEDREKHQGVLDTAIVQQESFSLDFRVYRESGPLGYLTSRGEPVFDSENQLIGFIGTVLDITNRKQSEEQLQKTNLALMRATQMKDEFVATISHELRTPLNSILGLSEVLHDGVYGDLTPSQSEILNTIEQSGQHLLALINDILDLSKIEAGKLDLHLDSVSVQTLCHSCLNLIRPLARQKNLHLNYYLAPDCKAQAALLTIQVDERRIRQVLLNLLSNAVKFTPEGGIVTLSIRQERDSQNSPFLVFSVSDTGIGISPPDQALLFQPFVQIDSRLSRKHSGTGLGLVLVKNITELHGGWIEVESQLGHGSCFTVWLPVEVGTDEGVSTESHTVVSPSPIPPSPTNAHPSPVPLILIVDRNREQMSTIADYLEGNGYKVMGVPKGGDMVQPNPHLILMEGDGNIEETLDAIVKIRQHPTTQAIPLITFSNAAKRDLEQVYLQAGASTHLFKPLRLKQLIQTIQSLLVATASVNRV